MLRRVAILLALLALGAAGAWLVRRARPGFVVGPAGSAAARAEARPGHPCAPDAHARTHLRAAPGQPATVDVIALRHDAGTRVWVGDTARHVCLGAAVRGVAAGGAPGWLAYLPDDARAAFVRSSDLPATASAEGSIRTIVARAAATAGSAP